MAKNNPMKNTKQQIKKSIKTAVISSTENNINFKDKNQFKKSSFSQSKNMGKKFDGNKSYSKSESNSNYQMKTQRGNLHDKRKSNFVKGGNNMKFSDDRKNFNRDNKFKGDSKFGKNNGEVKEKEEEN